VTASEIRKKNIVTVGGMMWQFDSEWASVTVSETVRVRQCDSDWDSLTVSER
jgi:hypothetical protein